MIEDYKNGMSIPEIGKKYDYNRQTVSLVFEREGIRKIKHNAKSLKSIEATINIQIVLEIRTKYDSNKYSQQDLSDEFKISRTTIGRIVRKEICQDI